jgi:predicted transcriptional regulator
LQVGNQPGNRLSIEAMSAKDILLEVAEKLPPDATLSNAIYELEFRQAVQQGLDEQDRGEGVPIEQVKAKIAAWTGSGG